MIKQRGRSPIDGKNAATAALRALAVFFIALLGGAFTEGAFASDVFTALTYSMAVPTGELKDFTGEGSFRGFSVDYRRFLRDRFSVGLGFGWQAFNELESGTFRQGTVTATGTQIRYATGYPLMGTAYLYTGDSDSVRFYAGMQTGLYYISRRFEFGIYSFYEDSFQFGVIPEAGVLLPLARTKLIGNVRYHYAFPGGDADAFSHLAFNVGIAFDSY